MPPPGSALGPSSSAATTRPTNSTKFMDCGTSIFLAPISTTTWAQNSAAKMLPGESDRELFATVSRLRNSISTYKMNFLLMKARQKQWSRSIGLIQELLKARNGQLGRMLGIGKVDPELKWLTASDLMGRKVLPEILVELARTKRMRALDLLQVVKKNGPIPVADLQKILRAAEEYEIDRNLGVLLPSSGSPVAEDTVRAILDYVKPRTLLRRRTTWTPTEEAVAWERNALLVKASRPGAAPLGRLPWLTHKEVARVDAGAILGTLLVNRFVCPVSVVKHLLLMRSDTADKIRAVVTGVPSSIWPRRAIELVQCWKGPAKAPEFRVLFSAVLKASNVMGWNRVASCTPGLLAISASKLPRPVQLVAMMVEAGYPMHHERKNGSTDHAKYFMAVANRRLDRETIDGAMGPITQSALAWLAHQNPSGIETAIHNGHRITKEDYDHIVRSQREKLATDDPGALPDASMGLLRRAVSPMMWSPSTHALFPRMAQECVETVLAAAKASTLPRLPMEMWQLIFRFVYPSNGPIAVGWT